MVESVRSPERTLARHLLRIGAVTFSPYEPYTWASGIRSPIYCDNRLVISHPDVRTAVAEAFVRVIESRGDVPDVVAGTATAGIPHAAWVSDRLVRPMVYVRGAPKGHGRKSCIEGVAVPGQSVVVIEDLVSTGGSSIGAVRTLREAGLTVDLIAAIFTYELPVATTAFALAGVSFVSLTSFSFLIEEAAATDSLTAHEIDSLKAWHEDPERWTPLAR